MAEKQEPVAWAIQWNGDTTPDCESCWRTKGICEDVLSQAGSRGKCVPVYMAPQLYMAPQPVLTAEERNAIAWAAAVAEEWDRDSIEWAIQQSIRLRDGKRAATLRSLLERLK